MRSAGRNPTLVYSSRPQAGEAPRQKSPPPSGLPARRQTRACPVQQLARVVPVLWNLGALIGSGTVMVDVRLQGLGRPGRGPRRVADPTQRFQKLDQLAQGLRPCQLYMNRGSSCSARPPNRTFCRDSKAGKSALGEPMLEVPHSVDRDAERKRRLLVVLPLSPPEHGLRRRYVRRVRLRVAGDVSQPAQLVRSKPPSSQVFLSG